MNFDWILQSRKHRTNVNLIVAMSPKKPFSSVMRYIVLWRHLWRYRKMQTLKHGTPRSPISWRLHWYLHHFSPIILWNYMDECALLSKCPSYMCSTLGIPASIDSFEWSIRWNLFTFIHGERRSRNLAHFLRLLIGYWKYLQSIQYVRINSISRSHTVRLHHDHFYQIRKNYKIRVFY